MQHVPAVDFASLSPAAAKKAALAAFSAAVLDQHGADWQAVAYGLHAALTAKRAAKADEPAPDGFLPWYAPESETYGKRATASPRIDFLFCDGVTVSAAAWQKGKNPINIGLACRVAFSLYRAKTLAESVPAVASVTYRETGEAWNPETINAATEAARATVNLVPAFPTIDKTEAMMRRHVVAARNRVLSVIGDPVAEVSCQGSMAETFKPVMMREPLAYPCDADCEAAIADPAALAAHETQWRIVPLIASEVTHPSQFELERPSDAPPASVDPVEATPSDAPLVSVTVEVADACPMDDAEYCPLVSLVTGQRSTIWARQCRLYDATSTFAAMPEAAAIPSPSVAPSRVHRTRLVALNSTAGVPLAAPVALRRDVSIRLAA